uniref:Uncharacterized protein n=1 Tax=Candidatus Kentrum sp. DK TaxID=2126562 RepID=A0A450S832_9GAMM|nr:MAG: hypothetical protein BECKDK2373B_GA0170837_101942 [Candidatus Kentron sp. DK]
MAIATQEKIVAFSAVEYVVVFLGDIGNGNVYLFGIADEAAGISGLTWTLI